MAESVVKYSYNGTEYSFVTKDPAQIEDLKCPICLDLVYEPVLTSCGHLICQRCVRGQARCPTCRDELQFMRDQFNERRVKNLKVKCPNWEKGCQWQGDLRDIAQHIGNNCQVETILCPQGCAEEIARGDLMEHDTICTHRAYTCPHCQFEDTFVNITTTHYTTCESFLLMCPAGCCKRLSRIKMAAHLAKCVEELVPCTYAAIGCEKVIKRKDLQTHLQDKMHSHLERAMNMIVQLSMGMSELTMSMKSMAAGGAKHDTSHLPLPFRSWLQIAPTCYPCSPCVIKMGEFQEKKENEEPWVTDPVYSHFGGYKMCLGVGANGYEVGKGTHVSVFINLMRGDNDNNLKWPFKGTIKVSLLNQLEDGQHLTEELWSPGSNIPEDTSGRVTDGESAGKGWGYHKFVSHQELSYQGNKNSQYLKDNTLFFRVDCFEPKLD